jgi:hypothetical protein
MKTSVGWGMRSEKVSEYLVSSIAEEELDGWLSKGRSQVCDGGSYWTGLHVPKGRLISTLQ